MALLFDVVTWVTTVFVSIVAALAVAIAVNFYYKLTIQPVLQNKILQALEKSNLSFYYCLLVGSHQFHLVELESGEKKAIYADAPHILLVKKEDRVIGILGFALQSKCILVYQMQGFQGVNVRGLDLADYILECAEEIAGILNLHSVKVQLARYNDYYDPPPTFQTYEECLKKQARLHNIYDRTASRRGYVLVPSGRWYEKIII